MIENSQSINNLNHSQPGRQINLVKQTIVRFKTNQRTRSQAYPSPFDSKRAAEILAANKPEQDIDNNMTNKEIAFVKFVWDKMPGSTCFYDAVCRIYQGNVVKTAEGDYFTFSKVQSSS